MRPKKSINNYSPEIFLVLIILLQLLYTFFPPSAFYFLLSPRSQSGLIGIITSPLIHADSSHLLDNFELFVPCAFIMLLLYRHHFIAVLVALQILSGGVIWLIGSEGVHIGYSGVAIGLCMYIVFSGFFSFQKGKMLVSLFLALWKVLLFQSIWYSQPNVSIDAHTAGAIIGILLSWVVQKPLRYN